MADYLPPAVHKNGTPWHTLETSEVLTRLNSDVRTGLSPDQASKALAKVGRNELPKPPKDPEWKKFLAQFKDPLVGLLLVAAVVATVVNLAGPASDESLLQRMGDAIAILIIVIINAVLGYLQERRAERALDALAQMTSPTATVVRGGEAERIDAAELVPGDIVLLETGDRVPADVRVLDGAELCIDESLMTGESAPVTKKPAPLIDEHTPVADQVCMAFMACNVVRGRGRGVVAHTGRHTHVGRIGELLGESGNRQTPLEERLARFGKGILWVTLLISVLVFIAGLWGGGTSSMSTLFLVAVSLAVAVIPEGLPAISTITLALGMQRMAHKGALVRRLPAVETLGCATVICSDKTGTLTCNEMTVRKLRLCNRNYAVTGSGYRPEGTFSVDGEQIDPEKDRDLQELFRCAVECSATRLVKSDDGWSVRGDPTEGALLAVAGKGGMRDEVTSEPGQRISEVPFVAERRMMSVVIPDGQGGRRLYVKGSPDVLLDLCTSWAGPKGPEPLSAEQRQSIHAEMEQMASQALRVLAFASRDLDPDEPDDPPREESLQWLGMAGMIDPPRPEVRAAIDECRQAQIRVVMVTGDHALTARAIAQELGMWEEGDLVLTGADLRKKSPQELAKVINSVRVFARVTAEQKMDIVRGYQEQGHVVAVTGDGVNDAPALKRADVGVAMGRSGTDVAREAADMVLADDNFATIVAAVREGRAIFRNIQKFIFFLCSSNAGLCVIVFAASLLRWPPALTPLMILWINLVTNGLPALALGVDPAEPNQMAEGPRRRDEGLLGGRLLAGTIAVGVLMGVAGLYVFSRALSGTFPGELAGGQLAAFMILGLSPLFHAFNCRSFRASVLTVGLFSNGLLWLAVCLSGLIQLSTVLVAPLRPVFRTTFELGFHEWAFVVALAFLPLPLVELFKAGMRAAGGAKRRA